MLKTLMRLLKKFGNHKSLDFYIAVSLSQREKDGIIILI
jgi:hypothetical protein